MSNDEKGQRALEEKLERMKRIQLKKDMDLLEFEDKGGFVRVLNDIFNPQNSNSLELDSVFQLKKLCKDFYGRKNNMSTDLISTLDALRNERPSVMVNKKRHFGIEN
jgi:hypothetical protein